MNKKSKLGLGTNDLFTLGYNEFICDLYDPEKLDDDIRTYLSDPSTQKATATVRHEAPLLIACAKMIEANNEALQEQLKSLGLIQQHQD